MLGKMWVRICTQVQQHSYMYATSRYDDEMTPPERPARGPEAARATRAPRSRVPWGTISREQVLEAATRVVKAGGYEEMTIRSLAAELGIAPMSLYRHVRDKDDILDEVVDRLLARAWRPRAKKSDWQAWVAEAADRLRRFLVAPDGRWRGGSSSCLRNRPHLHHRFRGARVSELAAPQS